MQSPPQETVISAASKGQTAPAYAGPAFSLLRLSALARCGGALIIVAALWAVVFWALA